MLRMRLPYVGVVCNALLALVAKQSVESFSQPGELTFSGYFSASLNLTSTLTTPLFATIFAAMLVAGETSRGTLRTVLVRPVSRWDFLLAKFLVAVTYLVVLVTANLVPALLIGKNYPLESAFDRNIEIPPPSEQAVVYLTAIGLALIPQIAAVAFGFVISVIAKNVGTAVGMAVGLLLSIQAAKEFVQIGDVEVRRYVFSSYFDEPFRIASTKISGVYEVWGQERIYLLLATSLATIAICLFISFWTFLRRDLNG